MPSNASLIPPAEKHAVINRGRREASVQYITRSAPFKPPKVFKSQKALQWPLTMIRTSIVHFVAAYSTKSHASGNRGNKVACNTHDQKPGPTAF